MDTMLFTNYFFGTLPLTLVSFLLVNESLKRNYKTRLKITSLLTSFVILNCISTVIVHVLFYENEFKILFGLLFSILITWVVLRFMYQVKQEEDVVDNDPKFVDLKDEKVKISCPNCQKKYTVPTGKHIVVTCKDCLYKWKTYT